MQALVVVAHPDPASLSHALAAAVRDGCARGGARATLVDLHRDAFDPRLTADEARGRPSDDPLVLRYVAALLDADLIAVVHPNCWGAPPAIMKGWMDRVFAPGAAYTFPKGEDDGGAPAGLLRARAALVVNTSNTTAAREAATFGDPLDRIWRDCLLGYCGVPRIERRVWRVVATSTAAERELWLAETADLAEELTRAAAVDGVTQRAARDPDAPRVRRGREAPA